MSKRLTIEQENACRAQGKRFTDEMKALMATKPKPRWNEVCPPILKKHHEKVKPMGISLERFISFIGRMNGRYGVES